MKKIILMLLIVLVNNTQGFAWGYKGHKIIAGVAKTMLLPGVMDSVQHYLGDKSMEDASVWMDDVRSDASYDYLKPMHYINVEKDKTYVKVNDPNIINELDVVFEQLQHRANMSAESSKINLMILFHLVEDLHQPLHTGYSVDKGGNSVQVDYLGTKSNLHKVWDTNIIESQNISEADCLSYIKGLSAKEKKDIETLNFVSWMNESRALLPQLYALNGDKIDQSYVDKNTVIVKRQLSLAAIRLAATLNYLFSKPTKIKHAGASKAG